MVYHNDDIISEFMRDNLIPFSQLHNYNAFSHTVLYNSMKGRRFKNINVNDVQQSSFKMNYCVVYLLHSRGTWCCCGQV